MRTARSMMARMRATRLMAAMGVVALCVAGCGIVSGPRAPATIISPEPAPRSALTVIVDPALRGSVQEVGALLRDTGRPRERVFVVDASSGAVLASSTAPQAPGLRIPGIPALPRNPTSFQRAIYRRAMSRYRAILRQDRANLRLRQRSELAAWAAAVAATVTRARSLRPTERQEPSLGRALSAAASQMSSMLQSGVSFGTRKVIAVLGIGATSPATSPGLPDGLRGDTIVVSSFPADGDDEAAWQASLLQAHAARVVLLTPATGDQLPAIVREGLDGAITITLTRVLFASGQYKLLPAAIPALRHLLRLLTGKYRNGIAVVNGYTDDLPVREGNLRLSQERAGAVETWLAAHGVAADRLQAFGYGPADPLARNLPGGQPLNRRVVVVIDPACPVGQVGPA